MGSLQCPSAAYARTPESTATRLAMNSAAEGGTFGVPRGSSDSYRERNHQHAGYGEYYSSQRPHGETYADTGHSPRPRQPNTALDSPGYPQSPQGQIQTPRNRSEGRQDQSVGSGGRGNATSGSSKSGKPQRICQNCGEPLTGQFVRALDSTFHLECFKCKASLLAFIRDLALTSELGLRRSSCFQVLPCRE